MLDVQARLTIQKKDMQRLYAAFWFAACLQLYSTYSSIHMGELICSISAPTIRWDSLYSEILQEFWEMGLELPPTF